MMNPSQQADRQWLDYLYRKSPSSTLELFLLQVYFCYKRGLSALRKQSLPSEKAETIQVRCQCDRHNQVMWHAYNPALNLSFSTYSHRALQGWLTIHNTLNDVLSAPAQQRSIHHTDHNHTNHNHTNHNHTNHNHTNHNHTDHTDKTDLSSSP
ncbi:MAG: hypothetical protein AB4042_18135 [Leptolyngbyaceae cyanobacterium]